MKRLITLISTKGKTPKQVHEELCNNLTKYQRTMMRGNKNEPILSVQEARKLLGDGAETLTDDQIQEMINTLDLMAKDTLEQVRRKVLMKRDAKDLANIIYDCYKDKG